MPRKRTAPLPPQTTTIPSGPIELSPEARQLFDEISERWDLHPAATALLRLVCEAITKAGMAEAIVAEQGMVLADGKGGLKHHPLSLLARDYRQQAQSGLQKLMVHLGS
jgi:hypothetical protein